MPPRSRLGGGQLVVPAPNFGRSVARPRQAPGGVQRHQIVSTDNQVSWENVFTFPLPGQSFDEDLEKTLVFRLQPGVFYSAAFEPLVVVAQIQWGNSNALNLAVVDLPSNSNLRIPLVASTVRISVATVLSELPDALTPAEFSLPPDFFENIPPAMFRRCVQTNKEFSTVPLVDVGVVPGAAISQAGDALPQRQCIYDATNSGPPVIPRPSGAVNVSATVPTGGSITRAQQLVNFFPADDGYQLSTVIGVKTKLLSAAMGVQYTSAGNVALTFDLSF